MIEGATIVLTQTDIFFLYWNSVIEECFILITIVADNLEFWY